MNKVIFDSMDKQVNEFFGSLPKKYTEEKEKVKSDKEFENSGMIKHIKKLEVKANYLVGEDE